MIFTHAIPRNYIFVDWDMSSICNYDCYYCNEEIHDGKVKFPDIQVAKNVVDKINLEYKDKDYAYFNLLGGEPTAWKHLDEFSYQIVTIYGVCNVYAISTHQKLNKMIGTFSHTIIISKIINEN